MVVTPYRILHEGDLFNSEVSGYDLLSEKA